MQPQRHQLEGEDSKLDVGRYLQVAWRRRLFIFLPVIFITSMTAVGVRFMSPLYVSQAKITLEKRTQVTRELERQIVDENRRMRKKDKIAETKAQITNREFLETVIRELGLHNDPTIQESARLLHQTRNPDVPAEEIAMRMLVRGLRSKIKVKNASSDAIQITISDNDPENAYLLAKVITRSFVDEAKRQQMQKLAELFKFSSQQSAVYQEKLDIAEQQLRDYQAEIIREQAAGMAISISNISQARSHFRRLQLDIDQTAQRISDMKGSLADMFDPLPSLSRMRKDTQIRSIERRLQAAAEDELMGELERMRNAGGLNSNAFGNDGLIRANLRRRLIEIVDQEYKNIDSFTRDQVTDYAYETIIRDVLSSKAASLREKIDDYSRRAAAQPEKELKLRELQQEVSSAQANLETFQRTVQNAELSEAIMTTQLGGGVNIVDPPEKPNGPVRPDKRRLVGLALLLSLMGGLGSVFAIEYLDKSFKDIDDIERFLGLHVIGTIPRVVDGLPFAGSPGNRKRALMLSTSFALLILVLGGMALYERLLRKQRVAVPAATAEAILQKEGDEEDQAPNFEEFLKRSSMRAAADSSSSRRDREEEAAPAQEGDAR